MIQLGLIGDNIQASRAPKLHRLCGEMCGLDVSYDLLVPKEQGLNFDALFARCHAAGYRGLNITLPYKIKVVPKLVIRDPLVRQIGSVNTVVFESEGALGYNTDYAGFIAAYRNRFGAKPPGRVALAGAGGAGKAVAFGLLALGVESLAIFDTNRSMTDSLTADLLAASSNAIEVRAVDTIIDALSNCDGVINCSPLGMEGYEGTAFPSQLLAGKSWAFDAVYTPMNTRFLQDAKAAGLDILGGYELHFYQGILAFEHFTGMLPADLIALRELHIGDEGG